jgi:energy-coupling factor transporter ATP-binding protein EcfA2
MPPQPPDPAQPEPTPPTGDTVAGDSVRGDKVLGDANRVGAIGGQSIVVVGGGTINYYGTAQPADPAHERAALLAARRAANAPSPYLGLQSFDEASAPLFFGRDALVAQLVARLKQHPFLAVLGPSGSGKSSVVRAGLVPALKGGALAGSARWLYLPLVRPGARPLDALAVALASAGDGGLGGALALRRELLADAAALRLAADMLLAADAVPGRRAVLVVDQFEELWTLAPNDSAARVAHEREQLVPFLDLLLTAASAPSTPLVIVIALRADFLHRAAEQRTLAQAIERSLALVGPLDADELRQAIEQPAVQAGGRFEPGLVAELVTEAQGQPGALPLLAYALRALWETRDADDTLTWAALRELGGVAGALAARAEALLHEQYAPQQQGALRRVLLRLVQPGEGTLDTRRRALLRDLVAEEDDEAALYALLRPLIDERLLTTGHDEASGAATVEVAHEALLRGWPTFARWVAEARSDLRFQIQVEEAAHDWAAHGQSFDFLWAGLRLANAEEWLLRAQPLLSEREAAFLTASREAEEARLAVELVRAREREELLQQ